MPELPEVEIIRQGLARYVPGKTIASLEVRVPKLFTGKIEDVEGQSVIGIRRRAKVLMIDLSNDKTILVHLKMTGQLVFQSADEHEKVVGGHPQEAYNQPLPHKHSHVIFTFTDGSKLFFNDLRKFGWLQLLDTNVAGEYGMLATVGPEPLGGAFTESVFRERLSKYPNRLIFQSLLDQSLVAGIGNIYANEALYEAGILPERRVKDITDGEWSKLYRAVRHVLEESIKYGGTSDNTYIQVDGKRGDYLAHAHVYHKKIANPCGHEVVRKKLGGRTTHFCPIDQT
ncbi:MAG TPA: bifunctional DNA-formamidopyrimidine glycosylase/DNA-(apurinic or apyrimidinic site) lyase [Patescibacteria group bacterium]